MALQLLAIAEIAAVAEAGHNVLVLVHAGVDGSAPEGGVVSNVAAHHLHAVGCGDDAGNVDAGRLAGLQQSLVGSCHRTARGEHRVDNDKRLAFCRRRCHVLRVYAHLGMFAVGVHAEGTDEGILGVVKHLEEALMEGQSCTQHRCQQQIILHHRNVDGAKRCGHGARLVVERLRQLVGHHLADTLDIVTEQEPVLLIALIANLGHELIHARVLFTEVDYFHFFFCF